MPSSPSKRGNMAPVSRRASTRASSSGHALTDEAALPHRSSGRMAPSHVPDELAAGLAQGKSRSVPRASQTAIASTTSTRASRRSAESSLIGREDGSSATTSLAMSSESEFSTPGTSKLPSPGTPEQSGDRNTKPCSIEVCIPSLRKGKEVDRGSGIYSMNSVGRGFQDAEIDDSNEDDDYFDGPDTSHDAEFARRLQEEEYASFGQSFECSDFGNSINGLGSARNSAASSSRSRAKSRSLPWETTSSTKRSASAKQIVASSSKPQARTRSTPFASSSKRARSPEEPRSGRGRPGKKAKVIADSEFSSLSDVDGNEIITPSEVAGMSPLSDEDGAAFSSEDDAPITSRTNTPRGKGKGTLNAPPKLALPVISDTDTDSDDDDVYSTLDLVSDSASLSEDEEDGDTHTHGEPIEANDVRRFTAARRTYRRGSRRREKAERSRLEEHHPELLTMWKTLEDMPVLKSGIAAQPVSISRQLKPFQLEGLAWMIEMEKTEWKGGLLGDEMGLGKTIQAVSLIMSDYPAKQPTLVLVPPVALMQWQSEISSYTDGTLKTFIFHGTNKEAKTITVKQLKAYDVIMMSYNSLEAMYRRQEKGVTRRDGIHKEKSLIHSIRFHRAILDEAHCIKTRTTMTAKACFALKTKYRWCLTGTPLQNRIGELFSLVRFLNIQPFTSYLCKQCPCSTLEWSMDQSSRCSKCGHVGMQHVSLFNQELLNPIQKFGNLGPGRFAFQKLRLMTDRIMLRRLKRDHTDSMELPVKEIYVDRQFFGEEENDFANSIMTSGQRRFDTYVAQGVLLNNYANIFGLIMQMRQVADHPDLILKKNSEGGQNVIVCCICDEPAEDTVRSRCKHDFCRTCVSAYVRSTDEPDCPRCHIPLVIDLEQPEIEQDETLMKKSSIINRIKMENWTSSSKIELLVHELHKLRSDNASHKSIIFSQFTTMLQLIEWRLRRAGITTVMLDGSMTPAQRQASIDHFMTNVDVECFLVSLKAGGVALNLTEASRVFIVDPWWNPAAEWQSADRCHRIGQTRPCTITRLCIEDSVESRMVLIQEKKTSMIHSTVNADDKAMDTLSPEDMQFLFRGH